MRKAIRVSDPAKRDLEEIWYYIATKSSRIEVASEVVESITRHFALLVRTPEAGTRRDEVELGIRAFPVGKYIIYYRVVGSRIFILRVIHGMRDQKIAYTGDL